MAIRISRTACSIRGISISGGMGSVTAGCCGSRSLTSGPGSRSVAVTGVPGLVVPVYLTGYLAGVAGPAGPAGPSGPPRSGADPAVGDVADGLAVALHRQAVLVGRRGQREFL